jgi:hypothetical protein
MEGKDRKEETEKHCTFNKMIRRLSFHSRPFNPSIPSAIPSVSIPSDSPQ